MISLIAWLVIGGGLILLGYYLGLMLWETFTKDVEDWRL